jgi:hypothetical protein
MFLREMSGDEGLHLVAEIKELVLISDPEQVFKLSVTNVLESF